MRKLLLFFFFLTSCSSTNLNNNLDNEVLDFNKNLTFSEFKNLLENYNKISSYPDIDK